MSKTLDFESDPFLTLLTDALRAGPGSPEWAEAVIRLRSEKRDGPDDEYALLCAAREDLARGRKYREVRAGAGFTRRLFGAIESNAQGTHRAFPLASVIAFLSLTTVLIIGALAVYFFWPGSSQVHSTSNRPPLSETLFTKTIASTRFETADPSWNNIGRLELQFMPGGLKPATTTSQDYVGGGMVFGSALPANTPAAIEMNLSPPAAGSDAVVQLFITDTPEYDPNLGTSAHELVWLLRGGVMSIVRPDGQLAGKPTPIKPDEALSLRLIMNQTEANIEAAGQVLFGGAHGLDASKPRYVGVRYLTRGESSSQAGAINSVRIQAP